MQRILVLNAGSSSLKVDVLTPDGTRHFSAKADRLGDDRTHAEALAEVLPQVEGPITAVGHRVVHGGRSFTSPTRIDAEVIARLEELVPLAPLHNPANIAGIRAALELLPDVPHVAVFDTAFHRTLPRRARSYALPPELRQDHQRYGFHGPSHQYVSHKAAEYLETPIEELRIITCHLGNGASTCAVEYGRSVETSMGMTPLEGLVMGTRSGDVDPGLVLELVREHGADTVDELLNKKSGLAGLSQVGNDLRDIEERASQGDEACRLAIHVFSHRLRKYIGAYAAAMGGVDVIVFTAGIGENSALIRHRACQRLDFLGARLSEDRNRDASLSAETPVAEISTPRSRVQILAVRTDEALQIALEADAVARGGQKVPERKGIPIGISARHIHLTREAVDLLFGPGHQLTPRRPLSQPGQFASEETLTVIGPKRQIEGVRILGPERRACQIEISRTDEFFLGVDAPVRASGKVKNSAPITLKGPAGTLTLEEGLICAWRHIHMTTADAEHYGVKDKDVVEVAVHSPEGRDLIFGDVLIRVKDSYLLEMHIDTDEANAAGISSGHEAQMIAPTQATAILRKKRL